MAFDPIQEDCLRLVLEAMRREHIYPLEDEAFVERCMNAYRLDPSSLIRSDRDRSFHLTTLATEIVDYRLPFILNDAEADRAAAEAEHKLSEAVSLDSRNWDAKRMLAALEAPTNDAYVSYLLDNQDLIKADLDQNLEETGNPYSEEYASILAWRPWARWLAALASRALIAGQYRLSLDAATRCLELAPHDPGDVRRTAMLAMAKLEYPLDAIKRFQRTHHVAFAGTRELRRRNHLDEKLPDAWTLIAELAICYHSLDMEGATDALKRLMRTYPRSAEPLYYQAEFPEGVFSRVHVEEGSQDELILALSEATPLLQEGLGAPTNASLAMWIAGHHLVRDSLGSREPDAEPSRFHMHGDGN